jgi:hypothetical protein
LGVLKITFIYNKTDQHHVSRPSLPAETASIRASCTHRPSAANSLTGIGAATPPDRWERRRRPRFRPTAHSRHGRQRE